MRSMHIAVLLFNFLYYLSPVYSNCPEAPKCDKGYLYRSFDGTCNNLGYPLYGKPDLTYDRLLKANYDDGISTPYKAKDGGPLTPARTISNKLYPDIPLKDPIWTLILMQYGQIVAHDLSNIKQEGPDNCCTNETSKNPKCFAIEVPFDITDRMSLAGIKCISFIRTTTDRDQGCYTENEPVEQVSDVNSILDLSVTYGNSLAKSQELRTGLGGKLKVENRNEQDWPPRDPTPTKTCFLPNTEEACYLTGDKRGNQNLQLTVLQVAYLREHNRVCDILAELNPHWDDEKLFQEARKICIGQHQYVSYYEMLPIFLGRDNLLNYKIIYDTDDFVDDYDSSVNPAVYNEHANAANRYFHSNIEGYLKLYSDKFRLSYSSVRLSNWFDRPSFLEEGDNFGGLCRGLTTQLESNVDTFHTSEITQYLFKKAKTFGKDMKAADVQRNRDHGFRSYNDYRELCGLKRATKFSDLSGEINELAIILLQKLYKSVDDIELTTGGSVENHVQGALAGPTFVCIMLKQFSKTRLSDRFWFERSGKTGFTLDQLNEIRKASISRLLCDNSPTTDYMQPEGFKYTSIFGNKLQDCNTLPSINYTKWKE
ncbi:unnamed protein product [Brassicogethes aeneus]|uniref:Peroxidase n=1 Tax=Brassicogethes aeneus TaxID=1431903 RepID=A0A9P0B844_BRAAE|nr:unnamed protein product [Brassicogethes aeneus]